MCQADLRMEDDNGLPRLLHAVFTPNEIDYIRIGLIGNMAARTGGVFTVLMHHSDLEEFTEDHNVMEIHNSINEKLAPLMGLALCKKCDQFHRPDCEVHNSECDGLLGVTL